MSLIRTDLIVDGVPEHDVLIFTVGLCKRIDHSVGEVRPLLTTKCSRHANKDISTILQIYTKAHTCTLV